MFLSNQTLILIGIILLFLEGFFPADICILSSYVVFSYVIAKNCEFNFLYQVIIFIISWWLMVFIHYQVFRKYMKLFIDNILAPTKIKSGVESHYGKMGKIIMIENELFFKIEDEIYQFLEQDGKTVNDGNFAEIIKYSDEKLIISLRG